MGGTLWRYHLCLDWMPPDDNAVFVDEMCVCVWVGVGVGHEACVCISLCVCSLLLPAWPASPVDDSQSSAGHQVIVKHNIEPL